MEGAISQQPHNRTITVERPWRLGTRLGSGGFGQVFEAIAEDGTTGVVKLIPKSPGAMRELLFEDLVGVPNIVPLIETGETDEHYVVVMPRAEHSLDDRLRCGDRLPFNEALVVLTDVAEALAGLDGRVVHRDIKPSNILFLSGRWCLSDFGIARFAEASTDPETLKFALTAAYAAPERWRGETATSASDIYSFGILAFELLSGELPFRGPSLSDFRRQHLEEPPPALQDVPGALAGLVAECLWKPPEARPRPTKVLRRLRSLSQPASDASALLAEANAIEAASRGRDMAAAEAQRLRRQRREVLYRVATESFEALRAQLRQRIRDAAPLAGADFPFRLGTAELRLEGPTPASEQDFARPGLEPSFEVIAWGQIAVTTGRDDYTGRSHSLWFCDAQAPDQFRWFENAWMYSPFARRSYVFRPAALPPNADTLVAVSNMMGSHQPAWPFTPVDQGDEADFIERWVRWFAQAAKGELQAPQTMPERDPTGSYRPARFAP
jgi:serine/threonine-protein kinase